MFHQPIKIPSPLLISEPHFSPHFHQPIAFLPTCSLANHLSRARRSRLEYLGLLVGRERGVNGADQQLADARPQPPGALRENLGAGFDLLLACEEHQDVSRDRLGDVRLQFGWSVEWLVGWRGDRLLGFGCWLDGLIGSDVDWLLTSVDRFAS